MGIGPTITDDVKRLIIETKLKSPDWVAKQVMAEVHRKLGGGDWPGISAIQKIISKYVPTREPRAPGSETIELGEEETALDQPWSIGASFIHGIPPDITPTLLEIRRWCIITRQTLTVRQAQWVAYLQNTTGMKSAAWDSRIAALFHQACRYALREKASKVLGTAWVYTFDLDIQRMEWDPEVRRIAEMTGGIPPRYTLDDWKDEDMQLFYQGELEKRGQGIDVKDYPWIWNTSTDPEIVVDIKLGIERPPETPETEAADTRPRRFFLDEHGKDEHGQEIYALCILYLSKGPKWDSLTKETRDYMAATLKLEIHKYRLEAQLAVDKFKQEHGGIPPIPGFGPPGPGFDDWKIPAHYLRTVGYDVEKDGKQGGYNGEPPA